MACALVPDGRLETEVALFLAAQAAARAAPTPQYGTSPRLSFAAISSPGNAPHVSRTLVVSAQARPEVEGTAWLLRVHSAPPAPWRRRLPVERPSWVNDGGLVVGLYFALNAFPATVCVSLSFSFSDLPPFILFVSLRPSLPAVLISSS